MRRKANVFREGVGGRKEGRKVTRRLILSGPSDYGARGLVPLQIESQTAHHENSWSSDRSTPGKFLHCILIKFHVRQAVAVRHGTRKMMKVAVYTQCGQP